MGKNWEDAGISRSWDVRRYSPKHTTKGVKYVRTILGSIMRESEEEPYVHKLRVSKLPVCGLLDAIERIEQPVFERPYSMDFYTSIGTALHETIQQRMIRSDKFGRMTFGDWKCSERDCDHILRFRRRPKDLICSKCKQGHLKYSEIEFIYNRVSGHMDMLTVDAAGNYVAWDFKTTNEFAVFNPKHLPYDKHKIQLETYCALLWKIHSIRVHSYTIVYISRNKTQDAKDAESAEQFTPFVFRVTDKMLEKRIKYLDRLNRMDRIVNNLLTTPTLDNLSALERIRPCFSKADYEDEHNGMTNSFFKTKCKYFNKGLCFHEDSKRTEAGMHLIKLLKINEDG